MSRAWTEQLLCRWGQAVTVETAAGTAEARAFLQPLIQQSETVPGGMTNIGWDDGRLWLYLGDAAADTGAVVTWNGRRFRVRSGRPWYVGQRLDHWWAVLEAEKEAAT